RWAATAVLRTSWSTVPVSVVSLPPPAARLAPQFGQLVAYWSSLAEQAGHVLCMIAPSSAPSLGGACWDSIDDRLRGPLRRRPQSDTWRSAGRRSDGAPSSQRRSAARFHTVNPARRDRPLASWQPRSSLWGRASTLTSRAWWSPGSAGGGVRRLAAGGVNGERHAHRRGTVHRHRSSTAWRPRLARGRHGVAER